MPATNASLTARASRQVTSCMLIVGGLGIAEPLAARQQLLQRMREQLVREHVLPTAEQLAGRDLVEHGGHLVIAREAIEHVALERLHGVLQATVIPASQCDLMAAHHRHRVGDFDRGVLTLQRLSGRRGQRSWEGCSAGAAAAVVDRYAAPVASPLLSA